MHVRVGKVHSIIAAGIHDETVLSVNKAYFKEKDNDVVKAL